MPWSQSCVTAHPLCSAVKVKGEILHDSSARGEVTVIRRDPAHCGIIDNAIADGMANLARRGVMTPVGHAMPGGVDPRE